MGENIYLLSNSTCELFVFHQNVFCVNFALSQLIYNTFATILGPMNEKRTQNSPNHTKPTGDIVCMFR